jgi:cell division protein FtsI/penicillin-binding protein 2
MAAVAFALGAIFGAGHRPSPARAMAERFAKAWARGDYLAMYDDIDSTSRQTTPASRFASAYERASTIATATSMAVTGRARGEGEGRFAIPVEVKTRLFGALRLKLDVETASEPQGVRVAWSRALVFPGLRPGEPLRRDTHLPPRASLLARDGSLLAGGQASGAGERSSPLGSAADAVVGEVGPVPASRRVALEARGVPGDAIVGVSGLERALDERLRGTPGGELLAGGRVLARASAKQAPPVRTTISPSIQRVAAAALGGQYGGIVAMDPSTGEILAVAGIGLDALQPPGSTFKMVTVTGVLEARVASPTSAFPFQTSTTLDGVKLENANGESCGGSLAEAFATSCNSVFAPLGVKLGASRLVKTAESFGFNHDLGLPGAAESTIPPPSEIRGELDLGSTAIGQGQVQASALQMALIAATIGHGGRRPQPAFAAGGPTPVRAIDASVARAVRRLMIGVVRSGTGAAAAIPGVVVAGKTGTAELGNPRCPGAQGEGSSPEGEREGEEASSEEGGSRAEGKAGCATGVKDPSNTDAWFAAFAPALHPKIAVGVLLVKDGAGGETAAPVARQVIEAALR